MINTRDLRLYLVIAIGLFATAFNASASNNPASVAFYYGAKPPVNALSQFDRIVLESENITAKELQQLKQHGGKTYAYLSIGEVAPERSWASQIPAEWTTGKNTSWNSTVMDLTNTNWQRFVLLRVDQLLKAGYDGLFLDTMDSYQISAADEASVRAQQDALANLIYRIKSRHPSTGLISNRGFEVMDKIGGYLDAVAAESLFSSWNNQLGIYQPVAEADRQWLHGKLSDAKRKHNIDVISIDYVSPADRNTARQVASDIAALGFIPWVANPALNSVGISSLEVVPREVIMLYDSRSNGAIEHSEVHSLFAMPLEYMGYVPVYYNLAEQALPHGVLTGAYAGAVIWNRDDVIADKYPEWLTTQVDNNFPVAMFGSVGADLTEELGRKLGLGWVDNIDTYSLHPGDHSHMVGFEIPPPVRIERAAEHLKNVSDANTTHLQYKDKYGEHIDTVITAPWGGVAIHPTIYAFGLDATKDWIIDPFKFLKTTLRLKDVPMPDVTSENGNRLWLSQIDGDAMPSWAELPGRQLGSEIIRDHIIKKYKLPHTISVVEAEMYTEDRRERMEKTARDLFALDYVEIATHSYSHPFHWQALEHGAPSGTNNLKIDNYYFDLDREIGGSAHYIDTNLAPPGKQTKVMLWTGDAIPRADAIATTHKYGLLNMNGGFTTISKANPSVTAISPNARIVDGLIQIYAPTMNENIYTNEWLGPFDGFRRVIETFEMTEFPRRIKPINVYYHFYAGTKKAALRSLEEIYDWSMQQDIFPVLGSYYIEKVPHFRSAGVARYLDGTWKVSGLGSIKSIRTLDKNSWPDLNSSRHIIGALGAHDANYFHTNGANSLTFTMQPKQPHTLHLVSSNAKVNHWRRNGDNTISVSLSSALPVEFDLNGDKTHCDFNTNGSKVRGAITPNGNTRFNISTKDTGDAIIDCKT